MRSTILLITGLTAVFAAPIEERQAPFQVLSQAPWNSGAVSEFQIHSSCNASQRYQLQTGLNETIELARHAKDHILRFGNESDIYTKYFGNRPTVEAIGALDILVNGDRSHALFRCDDPDGNCAAFSDYAGHWRGNNASEETVICPLSFQARRPLATLCGMGYNVRQSSRLLFWASDLMHRLYHIPTFGQGYVDHYAEGYEKITAAANANSANTTHDSDGLTYFALEAYAHDIINPGAGCPGPATLPSPTSAASSSASATATSTVVPVAASTSSTSAAAAATTSAVPENCHTHANGDVHCSAD